MAKAGAVAKAKIQILLIIGTAKACALIPAEAEARRLTQECAAALSRYAPARLSKDTKIRPDGTNKFVP